MAQIHYIKDLYENEDLKRGFERMLRQMDKQAQIANLGEIYADVMDYGDLEREKEKLEAERDEVSGRYIRAAPC